MHLEVNGEGKVTFSVAQQHWNHGRGGDPAVMQVASFAGQEMMAIKADSDGFELHYLGFKTGGYRTIDDAKAAAPAFARKVLARLAEMIAD